MNERRVSYEEALRMAQEHSIQALEAVLIDRETKIARLQQENERLQETLAFYADPRTWREYVDYRLTPELYPEDPENPEMERGAVTVSRAGDDQGERARQAIHPHSE